MYVMLAGIEVLGIISRIDSGFLHREAILARRKRRYTFAMSRRRRNTLILAAVLLVLPGAVVLDRLGGRGVRESALRQAAAGEDARYHGEWFEVLRVIDGDTLDLNARDGEKAFTRVRLIGVDTPETKDERTGVMYYGPEAAARTAALCGGGRVQVRIDTVSDARDRYGRLLGYVGLEDGRVLNAVLIAEGYGYADLRFAHSELERYAGLMDEAISDRRGLWKEANREDLPGWLRRERPGLLEERVQDAETGD